ncbi:hypothetical protein ABFV57_31175, partial [Pseudomonas neuropathica]|uniref:hypothetical protein n=1 Tax=Pseudomonas neuropathica TaxID=2730425 RepID=UPI0034D4AFA1
AAFAGSGCGVVGVYQQALIFAAVPALSRASPLPQVYLSIKFIVYDPQPCGSSLASDEGRTGVARAGSEWKKPRLRWWVLLK